MEGRTMKKLLSLTLALVMALGLALPASAAEETADEALARITKSVKDTLDLDTEDYDDFWGERYEDGLTGVWDLYWSGLDTDLSVSALDDGTVISYRAGQPYTVSGSEAFPTFPQGDAAAAARAADDFLDKVLTAGESVELGEPRGMDTLGGDSYRFSGTILLNGLPSPLSYSITVDAADNQVRSFSRDAAANVFLGDVPASAASVSRDRAAGLLTDTLAVKLEYVREADSFAALCAAVKSKRYPMTRIHRLLLCAYLGVTAADLRRPSYFPHTVLLSFTMVIFISPSVALDEPE